MNSFCAPCSSDFAPVQYCPEVILLPKVHITCEVRVDDNILQTEARFFLDSATDKCSKCCGQTQYVGSAKESLRPDRGSCRRPLEEGLHQAEPTKKTELSPEYVARKISCCALDAVFYSVQNLIRGMRQRAAIVRVCRSLRNFGEPSHTLCSNMYSTSNRCIVYLIGYLFT